MSNLYLVRHGQAGTRDAYDSLSELGRRQSRLLGEWFASQAIRFAAAYCGELCRQRQTAEAAGAGYGDRFPEIIADPGWNEFDLDRMYRELAPQLCSESPVFRREYEAMRRELQASKEGQDGSVHRRWLPCDNTMVNAWIAGHEYAGESWLQFCERVRISAVRLRAASRQENIVVFTSATPISLLSASALDIADARVMKLAGVLQNSSFTVVQIRDATVRLFSFNAIPHLPLAELRSFR